MTIVRITKKYIQTKMVRITTKLFSKSFVIKEYRSILGKRFLLSILKFLFVSL